MPFPVFNILKKVTGSISPTDYLVYYPLDNSYIDLGPNGYNLSLKSGSSYKFADRGGNFDKAFFLTNVSKLAYEGASIITSGNITVRGWVKFVSWYGRNDTICDFVALQKSPITVTDFLAISRSGNNSGSTIVDDSGLNRAKYVGPSILDGEWHHYSIVYEFGVSYRFI